MGKHIAIVGVGALGGYVGGHLARAGHDVTLIDFWPANIEAIRLPAAEMRDDLLAHQIGFGLQEERVGQARKIDR